MLDDIVNNDLVEINNNLKKEKCINEKERLAEVDSLMQKKEEILDEFNEMVEHTKGFKAIVENLHKIKDFEEHKAEVVILKKLGVLLLNNAHEMLEDVGQVPPGVFETVTVEKLFSIAW